MRRTLRTFALLALIVAPASAQVFLPQFGGPFVPVLAANLGSCVAGRENGLYMVSNAASSSVCTGTGTAASLCVCDGSAWRAIGGALAPTATLASTVTVADAAGDTSTFPALAGAATGSLPILTDPGLSYQAATNALTATTFVGALTGNADTVTTADAGGDTSTFPMLATTATGSLAPATDAGLSYQAASNTLTATTFAGALTGNADTATTATAIRELAAAPAVCDAVTSLGQIYIDQTGPDLCWCSGSGGWVPADGTGTCA